MVRTRVELTDAQIDRVRHIAAREGRSMSEVIRDALDAGLEAHRALSREEIRTRARKGVGGFRDVASDVSARHDDYLAEAYGQ